MVVHDDLERRDLLDRRVPSRGVEFSSPPTKYDWGWGATVRDPDGNEIYLTPGD